MIVPRQRARVESTWKLPLAFPNLKRAIVIVSAIYHADWGMAPQKRWIARAAVDSTGRYLAQAPSLLTNHELLIPSIRSEVAKQGCALVGFDFPIGIPASYAKLAGVSEFKSFLRALGDGAWANFYKVCRSPSEISVHRPFYPDAPGQARQAHLLGALGLGGIDELRRDCEKKQADRRAACPLFWTLGANQVGKGAIIGWKEVLAPELKNSADVYFWPFDGYLNELLRPSSVVIVETYPAECYGWFLKEPLKGKGRLEIRKSVSGPLLNWADSLALDLDRSLVQSIEQGFPEGDDAFDAVVGLFGMVAVRKGKRAPGEPVEHRTRKLEGWILGQRT